MCLLWMHSSHANTFYHSLLIKMVVSEVLTESDIWWPATVRRNSYQPVLLRMCGNCTIMEAWIPFMTCRIIMHPQNVTVRQKFSVHNVCKLWSHCSHCNHILHDYRGALWWMPRPLLSPLRWQWYTTPTSILNDVILSMETERSAKACCWGE